MRWYQFQLRKPKRWSRRAKSDGSAVPKIKLRIRMRVFRWYRRFQWIHTLAVILAMMPMLGILAFMLGYQLEREGVPLSALFTIAGIPSLVDLFGIWLRVSLIALQFGAVVLILNLAVFILGLRAERSNAIAHRCHLCPRCGYSLQSRTSDDQPCPECGQRISRREAVRLWARFCR
jgi:ssDNA-binding Zn-finger/Zn-ribbon topoisomerase 1